MKKFGPFSVEAIATKPNDPKTFPPFVRIQVHERDGSPQLMTDKEIGEHVGVLRSQLDQLEQAAKEALKSAKQSG